jgi:hypothetical protein
MPTLAATAGCDGALHLAYATAGGLVHRAWTRGTGWGRPFPLAVLGATPEWSRGGCPAPPRLVWVGGGANGQRGRSVNQLFSRTLRGGSWGNAERVFSLRGRYSHYPVLMTDRSGLLHGVWLQDTDGTLFPEALYHATSRDGVTWTPARDVTPPELRGGVFWMVRGAVDEAGRPRLAVRFSRGGGPGASAVYTLRLDDGRWSRAATLADAVGDGEAQMAAAPGRASVAAWRGADGRYRYVWAREPDDSLRAPPSASSR